jgi:hypothetical protein
MAKRAAAVSFETIRVRVSQLGYAEAIQSAAAMGQPLEVWATDAIAHHVYRCEQLKAQERYRADMALAIQNGAISPQQWEDKYQVTRPKPEITRPAGQGSGPVGKSYRP